MTRKRAARGAGGRAAERDRHDVVPAQQWGRRGHGPCRRRRYRRRKPAVLTASSQSRLNVALRSYNTLAASGGFSSKMGPAVLSWQVPGAPAGARGGGQDSGAYEPDGGGEAERARCPDGSRHILQQGVPGTRSNKLCTANKRLPAHHAWNPVLRFLVVPEQAYSWDMSGSPAADVEAADHDAEGLHDLNMPHGAADGVEGGILEEVGMGYDTQESGQGCAS